jgi:glutathione S-transferase
VGLGVAGVDDEEHAAQDMVAVMGAVLYVVPASHPCAAVERALGLKGLAYRRVDLLPVAHVALQLARFGKRTVPGIVFEGGEKLVGSGAIFRRLDELAPEPPLYPVEEGPARIEVQRAERWGEEVLQPIVRRLVWATLRRRTSALPSYSEGADLPVPVRIAALGGAAVAAAEVRLNEASDANARADLINLPFHLDRVDRWCEEGVLAGEDVSAADLQIGASLRLLLTLGDVAPFIEGRPAGTLARAQFPAYPGHVPSGVLPAAWLP